MKNKIYKYIKHFLESRSKKDVNIIKNKIKNDKPIIGEFPISIQIQTVSKCNGKCVFCPYVGSWQDLNSGTMDDTTFNKIIAELSDYKIDKFCAYFENEPLFDKKIFTRIEHAYKTLNPKSIELATNLSIYSDSIEKEFERVFTKIPHEIRISFHGINKDSYSEIMGLDFEKTLQNVHKLLRSAQDNNLNIKIRGAGVPRVQGKLKNWFSEKDYLAFWDEQLKPYSKKPNIKFFTYHDRAAPKQLKDSGMVFDNIVREDLTDFYCCRFDKWLHFLYTGEPVLCCMDYNRETVFSKSIKHVSIKEMIDSDEFKLMISKAIGLIDSKKDFICKRCISPGG